MRFIVPDISCSHCVGTIESALKKINGIKKYKVDLKTKEVYLEGNISKETVISAIEDAGYSPKEIEE